jgi:acyl-CoA synthetase (AMP-forming)/AMP-acid ligase II
MPDGQDPQGMKFSDALLSAWNKTVERRGAAPAIFRRDGEVARTFPAIELEAAAFAKKLLEFPPGAVLAVQIGNHVAWPAIFLACLRQRLVVLPLDESIGTQEREAALRICHAVGIITVSVGGEEVEILPFQLSLPSHRWDNNAPCLLKLTSGTTAAPRAIRFRSEQLLADCEQICATMAIRETDINFGVIPISHSYGFSNLLTPLIAHAVPVVLSVDRVPRAVLADLNRSRATVFPGTPVFYQAFCEMTDVQPPPALRLCISAGAPLPAATAKKFYQRFGLAIHSFYGSSECGGICYDRSGKVFADGYVGEPMENVDVESMEPAAKLSRIRVRGAAVADDYYPKADREKLGDGVFVPDDVLAREGIGFRIAGRTSDVINVAGRKVNPAEVEAELAELPGIQQAVVFGRKSQFRNEEVAACVVAGADVSESHLLQLCRKRLSGWQVPKRIFVVEKMPVNERGKVSRRELARLFAER